MWVEGPAGGHELALKDDVAQANDGRENNKQCQTKRLAVECVDKKRILVRITAMNAVLIGLTVQEMKVKSAVLVGVGRRFLLMKV